MAEYQDGTDITTNYENGKYTVEQNTPSEAAAKKRRYEINWSFGPVTVTGCADPASYEIEVTIKILQFAVGTFKGNLNDGLVINVNLFIASGTITFYLKNEKELWVRLELNVLGQEWKADNQILTLP